MNNYPWICKGVCYRANILNWKQFTTAYAMSEHTLGSHPQFMQHCCVILRGVVIFLIRYNVRIIPHCSLCHLVFYSVKIFPCCFLSTNFDVTFRVASSLVATGYVHDAEWTVAAMSSHKAFTCLTLLHNCFKVFGRGRQTCNTHQGHCCAVRIMCPSRSSIS